MSKMRFLKIAGVVIGIVGTAVSIVVGIFSILEHNNKVTITLIDENGNPVQWVQPVSLDGNEGQVFEKTKLEEQIDLAKQGDMDAQYNLARMYEEHEGGAPLSIMHAYVWFNIAKANGHSGSEEGLIRLSEKLEEEAKLLEAQKLSVQCINSRYENCD